MELKEAIMKRRSIRKYHDKPVSDDILHEILETAVWAPSGVNLQPWYFVVVRSPEERAKLSDLLLKTKKLTEPGLVSRFKDHPKVVEETLTFMETMGGAPVLILAFLYTKYESGEMHTSSVQSVAAALQNIALLAHEKGLGSCWTTGTLQVAKEMEARYGEGKGDYMAMMSIGYCDFPESGPKRKQDRIAFL
jgi:nitroreductase